MSFNSERMCRLCLQECNEVCFLFSKNIIEMVKNLTNIQLLRDERLPSNCCTKCLIELEKACYLKTQILESYETLQLHLQEQKEFERKSDDRMAKGDTNQEDLKTAKKCNNQFNRQTAEKEKLPRKLFCEHCDATFEDSKKFKAHLSKHSFTTCPECNQLVRSDNFKRHFVLHNASTEICEICGKIAKNKESLRVHMFYQHRENAELIKCDQCNLIFRNKYKYKLHIQKSHIGERNYQCEMCGKKFFTVFDTTRHRDRTHLRLKVYTCSTCSRSFSSAYSLKIHVLQHTQETPFRCDICAAGFKQKVSLKNHLKSKHNLLVSVKPTEGVTEDKLKTANVVFTEHA